MMPAYSGIEGMNRVVEDVVSKPDNNTDDTLRVIKETSVVVRKCDEKVYVRHQQWRCVLTRHPERRASLRPCAPYGGV